MTFHQNNHYTPNFPRTTGTGFPQRKDDDRIKRIETDNFNLRRQLEETTKANNVLKENYLKQQTDLGDAKAKNKLLETNSIAHEAEIIRTRRLFVNACKKRDPHALYQKVEELNGKLQDTEQQLSSVKNENQNLKRKLSDDHTEIKNKRLKLAEKCTKLFQCQEALKNMQEKCTTQTNELAKVHETLKTTKEKITKLEDKRDSQINLLKTQNECIRELKGQVNFLQPSLQENQRLQQSLEEAQKNTRDLEQAIGICKSKTKKLQNRNYNLVAKLKRKQTELNGNLVERNHLFQFAQDVGILIQFPLSSSSPLQTQLPEILGHLKETLQMGGCILQYQRQNQQPSTPERISTLPSTISPPPQNPSNEKDEDDQLYDEFTSRSMMNITFPLESSSLPSTTTKINNQNQTVEGVIILPQLSSKAAATTANAGNSQDALFKEIMLGVHQSVNQSKLKAKVNKAKKAKAPPPPQVKRTVTGISQTKKHKEDVSKRIKGRGRNCEGGAKYFCVCGRLETSLDRLKVHIEQFNQEKKFQCEKCPRRFLYVSYLKQHLTRTHHMPHALDHISFGCRSCGEMFVNRELYTQHVLSVHNNAASTSNPVVVAIENAAASTSTGTMKVSTTTSTVTAAPEVQDQPPQPNNVPKRVPSFCMDPEDEEVDVET